MESPVPARQLQYVHQHIPETIEFITACRGRCLVVQRPVNEPRPSYDILRRHKSPVAAVETVLAVVAQNEVISRRHHQLSTLQPRMHLSPPLRLHFHRDAAIGGKIVAEIIWLGGV